MTRRALSSIALLSCVLLATAGCSARARKQRFATAAARDYASGQYDKAKIEYMDVIQIDPKDAEAYARMGAMWADEGAPLRAGAFLMKALELAPDDDGTRLKLARVYLAVGRLPEARKEAITLLDKAADKGEALVVLVDASREPDDIKDAQQRVEKFPRKDSAWFHLASAGLAAKKQDRAAIDAALQQAVAVDPKLPLAHAALGSWYRVNRELEKAGPEFQKAADAAPVRSPERQALAEFKLQTGAVDEANALLKSLTAQAPDFLPAWTLQASIANRAKKYDEALRLIENALSRDANNIDARVVQAESWLGQNETKKALDSLQSLDAAYPMTPTIKYALARAYLQTNNSNQAMAELDEVARLSPNFTEAVLLRSELRLRNGDATSVVGALEEVAKNAPDSAPAAVLLAEAYRIMGRLDEAATIIRGQIQRAPKSSANYSMLGLILRQQNKADEASRAFEKAVELEPTNAAAIGQLIDLDVAKKDFAAAHGRVERLRAKRPETTFYLEGKLAAAEGKFDTAQQALLKAIAINPNEQQAYELLFAVYARANKPAEALQQLEAILAKNADNAPVLLLSGLMYDQLKDVNKARASYEKVLALTPNSVLALNNLAYIYGEKLNDPAKGVELAQKARGIAPSDPSVLDTLGWLLYKQGDYAQAADLLGQSASKNPENAEIQYHLGMADSMMGRSEPARTALSKAIASAQDFPGKDEAKARLALLDDKTKRTPAVLEAALKQQPNDPLGWLRLGEAYERDGAPDKAASAYERALAANAKLGAAALDLARLNAGPLKNPDRALEFAKKARELAPGDAKVEATVGAIALQSKNSAWAYSLLQESARALPDDAAVLHDLAWAAYSLGKTVEAQDAMGRALAAKPDAVITRDAQRFLGMLKLAAADNTALEANAAELDKVLTEDPAYVPALMLRARIQNTKGDSRAAAATYKAILERWPDFGLAQRDLAAVLIEDSAQTNAAYDLATKARKGLGQDPIVTMVLARVSYERGDFSRAIQLFLEMQRQRPLDGLSLFYLGQAYAQMKQPAQAKQALTQALERGLVEPKATLARQALANLGDR